MSFYTKAFTDDSDPYWACRYGVTTHPLYHMCDNCPSAFKCPDYLPTSKPTLPEDLPCKGRGLCMKCSYQYIEGCPQFNPKAPKSPKILREPIDERLFGIGVEDVSTIPEGFVACQSKWEDRNIEYGLKRGVIKPEDAYYDEFIGHYVRRKITFWQWLKRFFTF